MYTVCRYSAIMATITKPLTDQQHTVLTFVGQFVQDHGFPPTLREIGDAIGLPNPNAVRGHLAALEKKGYITKTPDKARSISLVHPPSALSRVKRRLHEVLGTDQGVFHWVVYGLAWTTRNRTPFMTGSKAVWIGEALDRDAVEHGWTIHDKRIEPDHIVVVAATWPNHAAQKTVHRLQSAANSVKRRHPRGFPAGPLWGKGYVATTDLELLDGLLARLLDHEDKLRMRQ